MSYGFMQSMERFLNEAMPWMYWKAEVALFLIGFFAFLTFLAVLSVRKPSMPRTGFLKIQTTLGDRIFISAASLIAVMIAVTAADLPWQLIPIVGVPIVFLIMWKG